MGAGGKVTALSLSLPRVGREAQLGRSLSAAGWGEVQCSNRSSPHPGLLVRSAHKRAALPTRGTMHLSEQSTTGSDSATGRREREAPLVEALARALLWKIETLDPSDAGDDWDALPEGSRMIYRASVEHVMRQPEAAALLSLP